MTVGKSNNFMNLYNNDIIYYNSNMKILLEDIRILFKNSQVYDHVLDFSDKKREIIESGLDIKFFSDMDGKVMYGLIMYLNDLAKITFANIFSGCNFIKQISSKDVIIKCNGKGIIDVRINDYKLDCIIPANKEYANLSLGVGMKVMMRQRIDLRIGEC